MKKLLLLLTIGFVFGISHAQQCGGLYGHSIPYYGQVGLFDADTLGWLVPGISEQLWVGNDWSSKFISCQGVKTERSSETYFDSPNDLNAVYPAADGGYYYYTDEWGGELTPFHQVVLYMYPNGDFDTTVVHALPHNGWNTNYNENAIIGVWTNNLLLYYSDTLFVIDRYSNKLDSIALSNIKGSIDLNDSTLIVLTSDQTYVLNSEVDIVDSLGTNFIDIVGIEGTLYRTSATWVYKLDNNFEVSDSVQLPKRPRAFSKAPNGVLILWYDATNGNEAVVDYYDNAFNLLDRYRTQIDCANNIAIAAKDNSFALSGYNNNNSWFFRTFNFNANIIPPRQFGLQILSSDRIDQHASPPYPDYLISMQSVRTVVKNNGMDTIRSFDYTCGSDVSNYYYTSYFPIFSRVDSIKLAPGDTMHVLDTFYPFTAGSGTSEANNNFIILAENDTINFSCNSPSAPIILGVDDPELTELEIDIYPNPTTGKFTLTLPDQLTGSASIELYDLMGKQVWSSTLQAGNNKLELDGKLSSGVYIYHVKLGGRSVMADRLVVY